LRQHFDTCTALKIVFISALSNNCSCSQRDYSNSCGFYLNEAVMLVGPQRERIFLVLICFCVLLAGSAHLLHNHPIHHHGHGKNIADVDCLLCDFSVATTSFSSISLPIFTLLAVRRISTENRTRALHGLIRVHVTRPPPIVA
jgi:hypothetical protein